MMTRRWCWMIALALGLGAAPAAFADPVDDLHASDSLYLDTLGFTLGGERAVGTTCLTKAPNSYDLDLNLRSFGFDTDVPVHLSGTVAGNVLTWRFDVSPQSPLPTAIPGFSIDRVHGQLTVGISGVNYETRSCGGVDRQYNVELDDVPGSDIEAHLVGPLGADAGTQAASNIHLAAVSGLGPAPLTGLRVDVPSRACARDTQRTVTGEVRLGGPAHPGGRAVHITSSDPMNVSPRDGSDVTVPAGEWSASFAIFVASDWSGTATLSATADEGTPQVVQVHVAPVEQCAGVGPLRFRIQGTLPDDRIGRAINNRGDVVYAESGNWFVRYIDGSVASQQDQLAGLHSVSVASLGASGQLVGTGVRTDGSTVGFVTARPGSLAPRGEWPSSLPSAITTAGLAAGAIVASDQTERAAIFNGSQVVVLAVGGLSASAAGINDLGSIAGTLFDGKSAHAFLYRGKVELLPDLGGGQTYVNGLSNGDDVVGYGQRKDGAWHAFRFTAGDAAPRDLGALAGYASSAAVAANSSGHVVGTVSGPAKGQSLATRGFFFSDQTGLIDLNQSVDPGAGAIITDVVAINDLDQILAHGRISGKDAYFVLAPDAP